MREILPSVWTWSVFNEERGMHFNGWYVRRGDEAVVVDPPPADERVWETIRREGKPAAVLLTNRDHRRASDTFRRRLGTPIWIHEADWELLDIRADRTFREGEPLLCGLRAIRVPYSKTPGETALFWEGPPRAWIIGDAVLGKPPGQLSLLPAEKFPQPHRVRDGLRVLLEEDFEALLLGDGEPILENARVVLEAFLRAEG